MTVPRRFGPYDVSIVIDGIYRAPVDALTHARNTAVRDAALVDWPSSTVDMDVNFFVLGGPDGITLVDSGTGPFWGAEFGHGRAALTAAGINPGDVRRVLITHLHGDHALGLFDGEERYFPEAEIIVPKADLAFFTDLAIKESVPSYRRGGFDVARRLLAAYGDRVKETGEGPLLPGIEAIAMPGHTPGHCGYLIGEGNDRLVLWGDLIHAPAFQLADPDFCFIYDADIAEGAASRRRILARAAAEGWIASGGHVSGFVHVEEENAGFRFVST